MRAPTLAVPTQTRMTPGEQLIDPGSPERALIASVLMQAIQDAFYPSSNVCLAGDQAEAITFLTKQTGTWAKSRVTLCDAIGLNPDALRLWAIRVLDGEAFDPTMLSSGTTRKSKSKSSQRKLENARRIWQQKNVYTSPEAIERRLAEIEEIEDAKKDGRRLYRCKRQLITEPLDQGDEDPQLLDRQGLLEAEQRAKRKRKAAARAKYAHLPDALQEDRLMFLVAPNGFPRNMSINGYPPGPAKDPLKRMLIELAKPYGATVAELSAAYLYWKGYLPDLCDHFDIDVVWIDKETAAIKRRPPEPDA